MSRQQQTVLLHSRPASVEFVVDKVEMGQVSLSVLLFLPSVPFHQCSILIHPSLMLYNLSNWQNNKTFLPLSPSLHEKVQQSKPELCSLHCAEVPRWQLHQWINMHKPVMHKEDIAIAEILLLSNLTGKAVDCHEYSEIVRILRKSMNLSAGRLLQGQQKTRQENKASFSWQQ